MSNRSLRIQARTDLTGNWTPPVLNTFSLIVFIAVLNSLISSLTLNRTNISGIVIGYIASITTSLIASILIAGYLNIFLYVSRRLDELRSQAEAARNAEDEDGTYNGSEYARGTDHTQGSGYDHGSGYAGRAGYAGDAERRPPNMFSAIKMKPDRFIIIALIYEGCSLVLSLPALFNTNTVFQVLWLVISTVILYIVFLGFSQSFFVLLDDPDIGAIDALKESAYLMRGRRMKLFRLHISFIGWFALGVLSLFIGFLWIIPYMVQSLTRFYMDLIEE